VGLPESSLWDLDGSLMNTTHHPSNIMSTQKKEKYVYLSIYFSLNNPLPTKMYKCVAFRATLNSPQDGSRRQASGEVHGGGGGKQAVRCRVGGIAGRLIMGFW
jgi:hypothetical protein